MVVEKKLVLTVFCLVIVVMTGCSPKLLIRNDVTTGTLAVCTQMGELVPDSLKAELDSVVSEFIVRYNGDRHRIHLVSCSNDSSRSLYLDVLRIGITNPAQQAAGVTVTTIGVITPLVMLGAGLPFFVTFAYLPRSVVQMNMRLSRDISASDGLQKRQLFAGSGQYFGSYEIQKNLLFDALFKQLYLEMLNIENRYQN
jgi:hypothetical protein